jgi:lipoprotein-anchoring transpeptidase ErfK/SrfK
MHDTLDERLAQLGGSLESAAEVRSPALVRTRGEQIRVAHRRRMVAMTAATAAVVVIGVGSLVAFRPDGGRQDRQVGPGATGSPSASAPASTVPSAATTQPTVVVDLKQDTMTVYDKDRKVVRTVPVTGGTVAHPSRLGTFTVTAKQDQITLYSSTPPGPDTYNTATKWVVRLDADGPMLYAAPWAEGFWGKVNSTHGEIGMSTEDAQWLYNHVAVGDRIQVQ